MFFISIYSIHFIVVFYTCFFGFFFFYFSMFFPYIVNNSNIKKEVIKMFINKVSVPLNEYNFEILGDIADRELITNFDFRCDYENEKIIIDYLISYRQYCRINQ